MKSLIVMLMLLMIPSVVLAKKTKAEKIRDLQEELQRAKEKMADACYRIKFYNHKLCGDGECDEPLPIYCRNGQ